MNLAVEREPSRDVPEARRHGASFETEAFRKVIKDHWKSKTDDSAKHMVTMLEEHAHTMQRLFNTYDYEIVSMPNVIATCKRLSIADARQYLRMIEALAVGFRQRLSAELTSLLLAGLSLKAKDVQSAKRYYNLLTQEIEGDIARYDSAINAESKRIDNLAFRITFEEASLLRFLKRRRISAMKRRMGRKTVRIKKLELKRDAQRKTLDKVSGTLGAQK